VLPSFATSLLQKCQASFAEHTPGLHKFPINLRAISKHCIRNGKNIQVNLFANAEAATYTMESKLHGTNLKMLHNNMQKIQNIEICRKILGAMAPGAMVPGARICAGLHTPLQFLGFISNCQGNASSELNT
jgi:hypothetical protein